MSILQRRTLPSYGGQYLIENERERFELFYALIPPLKELESYEAARNAAMNRKKQADQKLAAPVLTTIISAVLFTFAFAIPFLVVFYIVTNVVKLENGISLFRAYEQWLESRVLVSVILEWLAQLMHVDNVLCQFLSGMLMMIFMFLLVPCIYFLFPLMIALCTVSTVFTQIATKKELKEDLKLCQELEPIIAELNEVLALPLCHVPRNYQTSEALEYFCNCYINGQAYTVQEAIAAYDTYLHRRKMEHAQEVIHNDQTKILNELHDQRDKLDRMQDSIRRVKNRVDWL